jgi:hypothetical protein
VIEEEAMSHKKLALRQMLRLALLSASVALISGADVSAAADGTAKAAPNVTVTEVRPRLHAPT